MRTGARKGVRSFIMAGFILYISLALCALIFFMTCVTLVSVVFWILNSGGVGVGGCVLCSWSSFGIVRLVLCPIVI